MKKLLLLPLLVLSVQMQAADASTDSATSFKNWSWPFGEQPFFSARRVSWLPKPVEDYYDDQSSYESVQDGYLETITHRIKRTKNLHLKNDSLDAWELKAGPARYKLSLPRMAKYMQLDKWNLERKYDSIQRDNALASECCADVISDSLYLYAEHMVDVDHGNYLYALAAKALINSAAHTAVQSYVAGEFKPKFRADFVFFNS